MKNYYKKFSVKGIKKFFQSLEKFYQNSKQTNPFVPTENYPAAMESVSIKNYSVMANPIARTNLTKTPAVCIFNFLLYTKKKINKKENPFEYLDYFCSNFRNFKFKYRNFYTIKKRNESSNNTNSTKVKIYRNKRK